MEQQNLVFFAELLKKVSYAHKEYRSFGCSINMYHHEHKDCYWTIDFEFNYGNSTYKTCILFYLAEFDAKQILSEFDEVLRKASLLLKK